MLLDSSFHKGSDLGNEVARQFKITFKIESEWLREVDKDIPKWIGDDSWEVPLPATYVIAQNGDIVWSMVENDVTICAEMEEIVAAIPSKEPTTTTSQGGDLGTRGKSSKKRISSTFKKMGDIRKKFGRKKVPATEFLGDYMISLEE